jgi:hypothetical protein
MNYEDKAKEKLKQIEDLLEAQKKELETVSKDMLKKIQALPNDNPNKAKFNDLRNRILKAGASKDKKELFNIIDELKNI